MQSYNHLSFSNSNREREKFMAEENAHKILSYKVREERKISVLCIFKALLLPMGGSAPRIFLAAVVEETLNLSVGTFNSMCIDPHVL